MKSVSVWPFSKAQRIKGFYGELEILLILSSRCPDTSISLIFPSNPVGSYQMVTSFVCRRGTLSGEAVYVSCQRLCKACKVPTQFMKTQGSVGEFATNLFLLSERLS